MSCDFYRPYQGLSRMARFSHWFSCPSSLVSFLTSCFSVGRLEIPLHHISLCLFVFFILSILCLAFEVTRPLTQMMELRMVEGGKR